MVHCILLAYAVYRVELLVADKSTVALECVYLRDVSLEEDLESIEVHEYGCVRDDLRKEALILLVTSELRLAVKRTCDDHWIQSGAVAEDEHIRIEAKLPFAVHHMSRNGNEEREVHLTLALCNVSESCCHCCCFEDVGCDHLAALFVLDSLHNHNLRSVLILDLEGVPCDLLNLHFRKVAHLISESKLHIAYVSFAKILQLLLSRARNCNQCDDGQDQNLSTVSHSSWFRRYTLRLL